MPDSNSSVTPRVRFAPSPTGFLHVGSARTFIFNWLYARANHGTMIFRLDDTDVERNTDASVQSIYEGLRWLGLDWDEEYKQSERLDLHKKAAWQIFERGLAYRDFTPAHSGDSDNSSAQGAWLFNPGMREMNREESDRRAAAGEPFALRYRVPRNQDLILRFNDLVYGEQTKAADEVEDFALLRSDGNPTYHLASCFDDADIRITHIIRGQDHLTNTFKHLLIFEGLGVTAPRFAHLPLLVAPDGAKLSKRKHGPVVSVTTYRDAGFLPQAFINFLCLLGWSPKNDREFMTLAEITSLFTLENVNRANAVINFTEAKPLRRQSRLAQRRASPCAADRRTGNTTRALFRRRRIQCDPEKNPRCRPADPRAHPPLQRSSRRCRFLLSARTRALRSRRVDSAKRGCSAGKAGS